MTDYANMTTKQLKALVNKRATTKVSKQEKLIAWLMLDDQRTSLSELSDKMTGLIGKEGLTMSDDFDQIVEFEDTVNRLCDSAGKAVGFVLRGYEEKKEVIETAEEENNTAEEGLDKSRRREARQSAKLHEPVFSPCVKHAEVDIGRASLSEMHEDGQKSKKERHPQLFTKENIAYTLERIDDEDQPKMGYRHYQGATVFYGVYVAVLVR